MIEVNLIPDVKQELIKAQRARTSVISISIVAGIIAVGLVVLLVLWVFAVQTARGAIVDGTINTESEKLASVEDISNTLTVQQQLEVLPELHDSKNINSRMFDVLTTINPADPNTVSVTNLELDTATETITIEAQGQNGYLALEAFKKTINGTTFDFTEGEDGAQQSVPLASEMSDSDRSYGEDASEGRVLRFTLSFTYPPELFSPSVQSASLVAPEQTNVTDSHLRVPDSLFSPRAEDIEEEGQ